MKIVYIANASIPSRMTYSIHVMEMCQALVQCGYSVTLIVPKRKMDFEADVIDIFKYYGVRRCFKILYLPWLKHLPNDFLFSILSAILTRIICPNIVYSRHIRACNYCALLKLPVIFESHFPQDDSVFCELINRKNFKKLVVITHALKKYYANRHQFLSKKIMVAPDGANLIQEIFHPVSNLTNSSRLKVGYVGHLYKGKGMEIISSLVKKCEFADFHIVGGLESDISYWKDTLKSNNNIYFHGYVPHSKTIEYIISFDVLLLPNQKEVSIYGGGLDIGKWTSPMKLFEYMAVGKAIISSDLPVLREILTSGKNALLCDPANIDSWEKALRYLSDNELVRRQLGENARNDLKNYYTWNIRAKSILNALE